MTKDPLLQIDQASFSYGSTVALKRISAQLFSGKFYGIVGPNGCGKTTFLDLLSGSRSPSSGVIAFKGRPIDRYGKRDLAREIALVPQEYDTGFGYTVEEVVLMGRHPYIDRFGSPGPEDWRMVDSALEAIGIEELRFRFTNTLSGGQKQRAVVARALAQNSPLLLFDEATSSLDINYSLQIFNFARNLVDTGNRTVIAVIHDLNFAAAYCDEILLMKEGQIEYLAKTDEALTPANLKQVFGIECSVATDELNGRLRISYRYGEI